MSAIVKQLEQLKEATAATAEWTDLVSVEEIADKTRKTIQMVKDLLKEKELAPVAKLGKTYLYKKTDLLKAIKITA